MSVIHFDDPKVLARIAVFCVRSPFYSSSGKSELESYIEALAALSAANTSTYNEKYDEKADAITEDMIKEQIRNVQPHKLAPGELKHAIGDLNSLMYNCRLEGSQFEFAVIILNALLAKAGSML